MHLIAWWEIWKVPSLVVSFSSNSSFSQIIMLIVFCAFMNATLLSASCYLITIFGIMPALSWPKTGHPEIFAAALEVLHPLKLLSQNTQIAFLAQPFSGSALFVTGKYCQPYYDKLASAQNLHSGNIRIRKPNAGVKQRLTKQCSVNLSCNPLNYWLIPKYFRFLWNLKGA